MEFDEINREEVRAGNLDEDLDESFDYFESFNDAMEVGGSLSSIIKTYNEIRGFWNDRSNSIRYPEEHRTIVDRIELEAGQEKTPVQFEIAFDYVMFTVENLNVMGDENYQKTSDESERIKVQNHLMGDKLFVDELYKKMGVEGFGDMDSFADNPAYELHDDGFTYTNDSGLSYTVEHVTKSLSSQAFDFKGLSTSPVFLNAPKGYKDEHIPEFYELNLEEIRSNHQLLSDPYDRNTREVVKYTRYLMNGLRNGMVDTKSVELGAHLGSKIYDVNDIEHPKLSYHQIPNHDENLNLFFDDLEDISNDPEGLNSGDITILDVIHTMANYVGRHKLRDEKYQMTPFDQTAIEKQPTFKEILEKDLVSDGVVILEHNDGTYRSYVETGGFQDKDGNDFDGVFELEGMFSTKEQIASKNRAIAKKEFNQNKEIESNRKNYHKLAEKYDQRLKDMMTVESSSERQLEVDRDNELDL